MLAGDAVRLAQHLFVAVAEDDLAVVPPRLAGDFRGRQSPQLALDLGRGVLGQLRGVGEQDGGGRGAVFGLAQEVRGGQLAVAAVVGDDQGFGGAGQEVDAHPPEEQALGFGDVGVAGADEHVHGRDGLRAEGHGGHRLHAAQAVDFVRAAEMHGGDHRVARRPLVWRPAGDDAAHAGHFGSDHAHMRRGDHRILAARHVAADAVDRQVAVAEHHAGTDFLFHVLQGGALNLRETAHLRLGEADVFQGGLRHPRDAGVDVRFGEAEARWRPLVEAFRQGPHGGISAALDVRENAFHCFGDFVGQCRLGVVRDAAFQKLDQKPVLVCRPLFPFEPAMPCRLARCGV